MNDAIAGRLYLVPGVLTPEECELLIHFYFSSGPSPGRIETADGPAGSSEVRSVNEVVLPEDFAPEIHRKIGQLFVQASELYGISIDETVPQLTIMGYEEDDHFQAWHIDIGSGECSRRKISLSLALNNDTDFSGGDLEFFKGSHIESFGHQQGNAVLFPSFFYHHVLPVSQGMRFSLVAWAVGNPFS